MNLRRRQCNRQPTQSPSEQAACETHQRSGPADLLALVVVLGAVARAHELVLVLHDYKRQGDLPGLANAANIEGSKKNIR